MQNFSFNRILQVLSIAIAGALLTACGNIGSAPARKAPIESYNLDSASLLGAVDDEGNYLSKENRYGEYKCPSTANAKPAPHDFDHNGSRYYTVCKPAETEGFKILVHGRTAASQRLCVFPAEYKSEYEVKAKVDRGTNQAIRLCYEIPDGKIGEEGLEVKFQGVSYNAVFITEGLDDERMSYCLTNPGVDLGLCPRYSFGRFR